MLHAQDPQPSAYVDPSRCFLTQRSQCKSIFFETLCTDVQAPRGSELTARDRKQTCHLCLREISNRPVYAKNFLQALRHFEQPAESESKTPGSKVAQETRTTQNACEPEDIHISDRVIGFKVFWCGASGFCGGAYEFTGAVGNRSHCSERPSIGLQLQLGRRRKVLLWLLTLLLLLDLVAYYSYYYSYS